MSLGDLLEWAGAAALIAAAYLWHGLAVTLVASGLFLIYQAQCLSDRTLRLPQFLRRTKKNAGT